MPVPKPLVRLLPLGLAALALLPSGSAPAQAPLPAPLRLEVEGVRASLDDERRIQVTFTRRAAKLYRSIRGRTGTLACRDVAPNVGNLLTRGEAGLNESTTLVDLPRRRGTVRFGDDASSTRTDVCRLQVKRVRTTRRAREITILTDLSLPLTQRGAVFLDERDKAIGLQVLLEVVGALAIETPEGRYPSAETVRDAGPGGAVRAIEVLPAPDATPAAGRVGLYTDGVARATAVAVTRSGRRVFIDVDREVLSSNLSGATLSGALLGEG